MSSSSSSSSSSSTQMVDTVSLFGLPKLPSKKENLTVQVIPKPRYSKQMVTVESNSSLKLGTLDRVIRMFYKIDDNGKAVEVYYNMIRSISISLMLSPELVQKYMIHLRDEFNSDAENSFPKNSLVLLPNYLISCCRGETSNEDKHNISYLDCICTSQDSERRTLFRSYLSVSEDKKTIKNLFAFASTYTKRIDGVVALSLGDAPNREKTVFEMGKISDHKESDYYLLNGVFYLTEHYDNMENVTYKEKYNKMLSLGIRYSIVGIFCGHVYTSDGQPDLSITSNICTRLKLYDWRTDCQVKIRTHFRTGFDNITPVIIRDSSAFVCYLLFDNHPYVSRVTMLASAEKDGMLFLTQCGISPTNVNLYTGIWMISPLVHALGAFVQKLFIAAYSQIHNPDKPFYIDQDINYVPIQMTKFKDLILVEETAELMVYDKVEIFIVGVYLNYYYNRSDVPDLVIKTDQSQDDVLKLLGSHMSYNGEENSFLFTLYKLYSTDVLGVMYVANPDGFKYGQVSKSFVLPYYC